MGGSFSSCPCRFAITGLLELLYAVQGTKQSRRRLELGQSPSRQRPVVAIPSLFARAGSLNFSKHLLYV